MSPRLGALLLLLSLGAFLRAESGPDENAMFGSESGVTATATVAATPDAFARGDSTDNPLQIGGSYYQQALLSATDGLNVGDSPFSLPLQVDTFLDARPNDRLRAYLGARLLYDSAKPLTNNTQVVLDQAWLKFDLARTLFISAGKQHVKWGSARIWNPTDFLSPQRRDPLQPYDLRLGNAMLKIDVPFKAAGSSLSAIALFDNPQNAATLNQLGGAFRAETVIFGAEFGLDAVARPERYPSYGADLSLGLGPFDVYAEAALLSGEGYTHYEFLGKPAPGADLSTVFSDASLPGPITQASAGINTTFAWMTNRQATLGAEYFYNQLGATDASIYPVLLYFGRYQPFYLGRHYAALYLSLEGPDESKHTSYNFSTISNLSDASYVSRLDFNWLLLEHLSFGANADLHYGSSGGEFNFSLDTPALNYQSIPIPAAHISGTPFDLGLSLRLSF